MFHIGTGSLILITVALVTFSSVIISFLEPQTVNTSVDAVYFSITILTSVGFGDITPQSQYGKLFTMIISVLGMGIFGVVMEVVGQWRDRFLPTYTDLKDKPLKEALVTLTLLISFGCCMFSAIEGWNMHDSAYFSLIVATTGKIYAV